MLVWYFPWDGFHVYDDIAYFHHTSNLNLHLITQQ